MSSNFISQNNKRIDFEKLIKKFQIEDIHTFKIYLINIWNELSIRYNNKYKGIGKAIFAKYYKLPGIILHRLFNAFDREKKQYLSQGDFIKSMMLLFLGNFFELSSFVFNIYDYNRDGKISKDDIRIVLSYIPVNSNKFKKNKPENINDFEKIIEIQEELHNKLDKIFKKNQLIDENEFIKIVENENSDIFLYLLMVLYEKRPFNQKTLQIFSELRNSPKITFLKEKKFKTLIISPSKDTIFKAGKDIDESLNKYSSLNYIKILTEKFEKISNDKINKTNYKKNTFNINVKKINLSDSVILKNKKKIKESNSNVKKINSQNNSEKNLLFHSEKFITELNYFKLSDNNDDINLDPSIQFLSPTNENEKNNPKIFNNLNISSIPQLSDNDSFSDSSSEFSYNIESNENEKDIANCSGFMYKILHETKLKKLWFNLYFNDLFFYHSKNNKKFVGMLNLSGMFIKEMPQINFLNYKFYTFKLISSEKSRMFYIEDKNEYINWITNIKKAIGYKDLNNIYEIQENLEKGKYGLIKKGINKITKQEVVISTFSKKYMLPSDLEQINTQIEILRIVKHPNIATLYDVYENEDFIYLISEYYSGSDLFNYFEKKKFHLKEKQVVRIVQQLCSLIYFLNEYGIVHRDLKLENILMTNDTDEADIKILDFFSAIFLGPSYYKNEIISSISYCCPEILLNKHWDKKVDIWSLGVITYFLLSGYLPYEDDDNNEKNVAKQIINLPVLYPENLWKDISSTAKDFVDSCLQKDPQKRINIKQAIEHPWIQMSCETPLSRCQCKIKNKKCKIPGGLIFKLYSYPFASYLKLGNQDVQKNYIKIDEETNSNNNTKSDFIRIRVRKKTNSVKINPNYNIYSWINEDSIKKNSKTFFKDSFRNEKILNNGANAQKNSLFFNNDNNTHKIDNNNENNESFENKINFIDLKNENSSFEDENIINND